VPVVGESPLNMTASVGHMVHMVFRGFDEVGHAFGLLYQDSAGCR